MQSSLQRVYSLSINELYSLIKESKDHKDYPCSKNKCALKLLFQLDRRGYTRHYVRTIPVNFE